MKNAKASKLEVASPRRRGDSQIICRGRAEPRSSPRSATSGASAWPPESASEQRALARELQRQRRELEAENIALRSEGGELAAALERYTELFDLAPIASVEISFDARVRGHNQAASQLLGMGNSPLCGRSFRSLVASDQRQRFDAFIAEQTAQQGAAQGIAKQGIAKQGIAKQGIADQGHSPKPCSVELALLRVGKGRFDAQLVARRLSRREPSILIAFEDITQRKARDAELARAQQALREADRRKDEFLALLSHELRNPLTPLANCLCVLARSEPGSERAHTARSIMQRQVDQLTRLTEDLLDVTRIARGKMRLVRQRVDFRELIEHTLEDHRASFDACGVSLENLSVENGVELGRCWMRADPGRLTQAMSNLLGNALKFTPRGGRVAVRLERDGGRVALRVRDTGAGIAAEVLPWVFEPFAQAPQTLDRSQGGLGLGLAMVKGLVELHGGNVSVSSPGPGLGAELSVWLPLDASDEQEGPRASRAC
jgi:PAS domain S-box-containing protein